MGLGRAAASSSLFAARNAYPGASFYGTIEDAWYVPLTDIGFEGKGGKFLVLPRDYKGTVPDGYTPVRPATYNTMTLLRSILASLSEKDEQAGNNLVDAPLVHCAYDGPKRFVYRFNRLRGSVCKSCARIDLATLLCRTLR